MGILIDTIRVNGFRGLVDFEISLPRVAVLIGPNNSGKTSVIKALQLALGDYNAFLSEEDFHISAGGTKSDEIVIDLRIISTEDGENRIEKFSAKWQEEFGDKIMQEPNNKQFVALRTRIKNNPIKGGFDFVRYSLPIWPVRANWFTQKIKENKFSGKIASLPFIGIEAQRDLCQELKEKSSFAGKILSVIQYDDKDVTKLEKQIDSLNNTAVSKSSELKYLKEHLKKLNTSFNGTGNTDITPFPKKLRDLAKNFTVYFGEVSANTFSMEYHGMGTRSWASMLTAKAFIELSAQRYDKEAEPFFPLVAAEEPEAHLHPNAQKTLYNQLAGIKGQVIVSTHSPYLAAMAEPNCLRSLRKTSNICQAMKLSPMDAEETRKLKREVINTRGEILFSKAIVLCEGETEEQVLPMLFERLYSNSAHEFGVSFVGVGGSGARYKPFLMLARDFSIPILIFSDGETKVVSQLKKIWKEILKEDIDPANSNRITILENTDFEGYLLNNGFVNLVKDAISDAEDCNAAFITDWIKKKNGTIAGRERTNAPPCKTCKQDIFTDIKRNYNGKQGLVQALHDILDANKTKYASAIANRLSVLSKRKLPLKIVEFLEKIKKELGNA